MKKFFSMIGTQLKNFWEGTFYESTPEGGKKFSLGRFILVGLLIFALKMWMGGADIPITMMTMIMAQLGYVFGTKMLASIEKVKSFITKN